ncbi:MULTISPECIES: DUF2191 domain-containing protein [unclassified Nocardioides]|uniref:DUF2191 domain-containing protein n=1 Tax=unclassified Nocardioides TaxID=2615069 RepID=UPI0006F6D3F0|nr:MULTISPECIES: DUF2191 domain-containing protein [unclassified Nocardioides]KRA31441.1 hypothetical protein ASD81_18580 [Nocardioides sp. Root614]KRA88061.1 hypothetical protein ASD84_18855 [Nocardioides sp. Root682]
MRTTVNIHDGLLETVKARASEQGCTLGDLVEQALQQFLAVPPQTGEFGPPLPVFHGGQPLPGVDLTTNAGLYEVMYAEEDAEYARQFRS